MDDIKFVWLCGAFFTFWISLILLSIFWKKEIIRLAGLYAILPGLNMLILNLMSPWFDFKQTVIVSAATDIVFIIPIVHLFRRYY